MSDIVPDRDVESGVITRHVLQSSVISLGYTGTSCLTTTRNELDVQKKGQLVFLFVSFRHKGIQKTILSRSCNNRKGEKGGKATRLHVVLW